MLTVKNACPADCAYRKKIGFAIWILIGLLSGSAVVATVAAVATNAGFVVPPGTAPRYAEPRVTQCMQPAYKLAEPNEG